jgi:predicted O-methyltransferase YrrM
VHGLVRVTEFLVLLSFAFSDSIIASIPFANSMKDCFFSSVRAGVEYINYRLKSKSRYGIHSPFVYAFSDKCLSIPVAQSDKKIIEKIKRELKNDHQSLSIADHGAGSKRLGNNRKVSSIYRTSSSKGKYGRLLYRIAKFYNTEKILELGTSVGVGTSYLALANPKALITTVEGCPATANIASRTLNIFKNVNIVNNTFDQYLDRLDDEKFDLIFLDGHHDGDALLNYTERLINHMNDDCFLILDDIRWSKGMKNAWDKLLSDDRFHLSMDFFRMGILMKRPAQEKEHFVIALKK